MIQGTSSSAGKSFISAGLCQLFSNRGLDVYPYKSQNMSSTFINIDGLKLSSAQYIQGLAAGKTPSIHMNPILLVPRGDSSSQLNYLGKEDRILLSGQFRDYKREFKERISQHYKKISKNYQLMIIEGAGSPAEINLYENDFVNMGMAQIADSKVILITDIDRGGAFAHLYGTMALLGKEDRKRIIGVIFNKFRGDKSLLEEAFPEFEKLIGTKVLGIVPYTDVRLMEEDSLSESKDIGQLSDDDIKKETQALAQVLEENLNITYILEQLV